MTDFPRTFYQVHYLWRFRDGRTMWRDLAAEEDMSPGWETLEAACEAIYDERIDTFRAMAIQLRENGRGMVLDVTKRAKGILLNLWLEDPGGEFSYMRELQHDFREEDQ